MTPPKQVEVRSPDHWVPRRENKRRKLSHSSSSSNAGKNAAPSNSAAARRRKILFVVPGAGGPTAQSSAASKPAASVASSRTQQSKPRADGRRRSRLSMAFRSKRMSFTIEWPGVGAAHSTKFCLWKEDVGSFFHADSLLTLEPPVSQSV